MDYDWGDNISNDNLENFNLVIGFVGGEVYQTPNLNTWVSGNVLTTDGVVDWTKNAGDYIEISQLQVEEGTQVTEFERVPHDIQLLRCKRYFENLGSSGISVGGSSGQWSYTHPQDTFLAYFVEKRTIPTLNYNDVTDPSRRLSERIFLDTNKIEITIDSAPSDGYFYWNNMVLDAEFY